MSCMDPHTNRCHDVHLAIRSPEERIRHVQATQEQKIRVKAQLRRNQKVNERVQDAYRMGEDGIRSKAALWQREDSKRAEAQTLLNSIGSQAREMEELVGSLQGLKSQMSHAETERLNARARHAHALREEELRSQATLRRLDALAKVVDTKEAALQTSRAAIEALSEEQKQLEVIKGRGVPGLREQIISQTNELEQLEGALNGLKTRMTEVETQRQYEWTRHREALDEEHNRAEATLQELTTSKRRESHQLREKIAAQAKELEQLVGSVHGLENKVSNAGGTRNSEKVRHVETLHEEKTRAKARLLQLRRSMDSTDTGGHGAQHTPVKVDSGPGVQQEVASLSGALAMSLHGLNQAEGEVASARRKLSNEEKKLAAENPRRRRNSKQKRRIGELSKEVNRLEGVREGMATTVGLLADGIGSRAARTQQQVSSAVARRASAVDQWNRDRVDDFTRTLHRLAGALAPSASSNGASHTVRPDSGSGTSQHGIGSWTQTQRTWSGQQQQQHTTTSAK